ncbi:hypothetical protein HY251_11205 [bacterium]|nr:hypothetical protein [bacterium]
MRIAFDSLAFSGSPIRWMIGIKNKERPKREDTMSNNTLNLEIEGLTVLSEAEAIEANGGFSFSKFFGSLMDGSFFDAVSSAVSGVKGIFSAIGSAWTSIKSVFSFFG